MEVAQVTEKADPSCGFRRGWIQQSHDAIRKFLVPISQSCFLPRLGRSSDFQPSSLENRQWFEQKPRTPHSGQGDRNPRVTRLRSEWDGAVPPGLEAGAAGPGVVLAGSPGGAGQGRGLLPRRLQSAQPRPSLRGPQLPHPGRRGLRVPSGAAPAPGLWHTRPPDILGHRLGHR